MLFTTSISISLDEKELILLYKIDKNSNLSDIKNIQILIEKGLIYFSENTTQIFITNIGKEILKQYEEFIPVIINNHASSNG